MDLSHLAKLHRHHVAELQSRYENALRASSLDAVVIHSGSLKKRSEFWIANPIRALALVYGNASTCFKQSSICCITTSDR